MVLWGRHVFVSTMHNYIAYHLYYTQVVSGFIDDNSKHVVVCIYGISPVLYPV